MSDQVKVFCLDIDGVMTNGTKIYDKSGVSIGKSFFDLDWSALKRLKAAGVAVEAITGDNWNADLLYNRNISYTLSRGTKKEDYLADICKRYNVTPKEIAYIGDDIFDIELLKLVGFPFAPKNATYDVFWRTDARALNTKGGEGVIDELFYYLRRNGHIKHLNFQEEFEEILKLDAKQKF